MKIYAKQSEQPKLDRTESEMFETEKPIFVKMNDSSFVKKFIDVLSLEEHKGRDKFRNKHLTLFKVRFCFRVNVLVFEHTGTCKLVNDSLGNFRIVLTQIFKDIKIMVRNGLYLVIFKICVQVLNSVTKIFCVYQGLFRNYGSTFLPIFKAHIVELLADRSHEHHDSKQRCGMEILAGVIRGSKHWPYQQVCSVYYFFIITCLAPTCVGFFFC